MTDKLKSKREKSTLKMTSALSGNLVTFLTDGSDRMAYLPTRDEVTFGTDITCDIRFTQEHVRGKHFVIYPDPATGKVNFGRIMIIFLCEISSSSAHRISIVSDFLSWLQIKLKNFSSEYPVKVNGIDVLHKREIVDGDVIELFSTKLRWESKAENKRKYMQIRRRFSIVVKLLFFRCRTLELADAHRKEKSSDEKSAQSEGPHHNPQVSMTQILKFQ